MTNFATAETLQRALDSDELTDYCDLNFASSVLDCDLGSDPTSGEALNGAWFPLPEWIDHIDVDNAEEALCEYVSGCLDVYHVGDIINHDGEKWKYIDSIILPFEIEHQAEDGRVAYELRDYSFLRIWKHI